MTTIKWKQIEETVAHMTPQERSRLASLLNRPMVDQSTSFTDPLLGILADEPELVDQIVEEALTAREQHPLRYEG